ncbi:heparan-alpha-glucosaminide N-acetyltransferase domain-containing protein [Zhihengliuella sp.]|uniref:heparan-alpha-glucosaminide N-acetyltransferase domain-containing protein n=1 Tax=Zhihengliuella sp. TaxID=1954483 RepID=UPI002811FA27|nr:heparan-alpha-glucosaminide N-acetyltransferase domain-containing protein [Zhihengliuella sp.]
MSHSSPASARVAGVDAARGIALLGMMATHLVPLAASTADGGFATTWAAEWFAGRASALFAVLAGVGLALLTGGSAGPTAARLAGARRSVVVRALVIAAIGLACGMLSTNVAVILVHYGLLFLAAVPFLGARPRTLLLWAVGWILVSPVVLYAAGLWLAGSPLGPALELPGGGAAPTFTDLGSPAALAGNLLLTGYYPVVVWVSFVLVGLWAGRLRLQHPPVALLLTFGGGVLAVAARLLSGWLLGLPGARPALAQALGVDAAQLELALGTGYYFDATEPTPWWFALAAPHTSAPLDLLHVTGSALAALGACQLVALGLTAVLRRFGDIVLSPLTGAGSATLTLYVGHLVALDLLSGATEAVAAERVYAWYALAALVIGAALRLTGARGPLEALVRQLAGSPRGAARAGRR